MWTDQWNGKTIGLVLADAARCFSDKPAIVFENGTLTFNNFWRPLSKSRKLFSRWGWAGVTGWRSGSLAGQRTILLTKR